MGNDDSYDDEDETGMSWYERKQYDRQCETIGEPNMMPLLTGREMSDLFSDCAGLF